MVDEALEDCSCGATGLVAKRINSEIQMKENRDKWLQPLLDEASNECEPEIMDAEDPLFILYTSCASLSNSFDNKTSHPANLYPKLEPPQPENKETTFIPFFFRSLNKCFFIKK